MAKANFAVVRFDEHLGDDVADIPGAGLYTFVGNQTTAKQFEIGREPVGDGYLIIQVYDVQSTGHRIQVNGTDLPGQDIVPTDTFRWESWVDIVSAGILQKGTNTIRVLRASGGDNIIIASIFIHWREPEGLLISRIWPRLGSS